MSVLTTHNQYSTESLLSTTWQKNEIKGVQVWKEDIKLSLFANDTITYLGNQAYQQQQKNFLRLVSDYSKFAIMVNG